jgi:outer membrane protein assembly factor BamB
VTCGVLVFLIGAGCEVPRPRPTADASPSAVPETEPGSEPSSWDGVLNPSDVQLNLQDQGLKVLWRQNLGQVADAQKKLRRIYVAGDRLVAETPDGTLFYFNARSGVWTGSTALKGELWDAPILHGDHLYALGTQGLLVIDAVTGRILRQLPPRTPVSTRPIHYDGSLIVGAGNGRVIRIVLANGRHLWSASALGRVHNRPVVTGDTVYAAGYKGRLISADLASGNLSWTWTPREPSALMTGPELAGGFLYVGDNRGFLYCLMAEDGIVTSTFPCGAPVDGPPVAVDDRLLVFTYQSDMFCLNTGQNLTVAWQHPTASELLARGKNGLYLMTRAHTVVCVDAESGTQHWELGLPRECQSVSNPVTPTFYVANPSGDIIAVTELD